MNARNEWRTKAMNAQNPTSIKDIPNPYQEELKRIIDQMNAFDSNIKEKLTEE